MSTITQFELQFKIILHNNLHQNFKDSTRLAY